MSQRGHIVRPFGARRTWAIMYRDDEGRLRWEGKFKIKSDAQHRLNEALGEIDRGTYTRPSSLTFEQFAKEWLAGRRQIRGSTESGYSSLIKSQLIPRLGKLTVSHVRFEHVDAAVSGMVEDELASKTIHNAVMLLRSMLAGRKGPSAFRRGLAFADPTLGVKLPPLEYRQIVPPTPEQAWRLINAAKEIGGFGYPITYLGAFCGLRRAEVLALRFVSVRWFDNEIRVQYAISKRRCQDGIHKWDWYLGPPKSRRSLRGISAAESVMKLLADLKVGNDDSAFVFPGDYHGFVAPDDFEAQVWRPIVQRAGLPGTRFHDLRHFFASQLIANGETAAYIRDQMGHSSIHVTFDTYGHLFPGRGKDAADRYEKSMVAARRKLEADVSNPLAMNGGQSRNPEANN
jgi:integrase